MLQAVCLRQLQETLGDLLIESRGAWPESILQIHTPSLDSRDIVPGAVFFALKGSQSDGHQFIGESIAKGAAVIIYEEAPEHYQKGISYLRVSHSRRALSRLSALLYDYPERKLNLLGVTGTDGKSSTVYFLYQLLRRLEDSPVGLISTFSVDLGNGLEANRNHQTTPESLYIQQYLAQMARNGCRWAAVECSSHGLSPKTARLQDISFRGAVFTNLSPEHLEFHNTMEEYALEKARLFAQTRERGSALFNLSDPNSEILYTAARQMDGGPPSEVWGYGFSDSRRNQTAGKLALPAAPIPYTNRFLISEPELGLNGSRFRLSVSGTQNETQNCFLSVPGSFYIENAAAALALTWACYSKELSWEDFLGQIGNRRKDCLLLDLEAPKGRMQRITEPGKCDVLIDYAHTPGSMERLLPEIKQFTEQNRGKLIVLFGSAGERDIQKRPLQGEIAAQYADFIVLSNEDPRGEEPQRILQDIRSGIPSEKFTEGRNLFLIPDRKTGITKALSLARSQDTVLLLGKGHENSILLAGGQMIPWDESGVTRALLTDTP